MRSLGDFFYCLGESELCFLQPPQENVLTIEYVESMQPPAPLSGYKHDEWVSAVKGSQRG